MLGTSVASSLELCSPGLKFARLVLNDERGEDDSEHGQRCGGDEEGGRRLHLLGEVEKNDHGKSFSKHVARLLEDYCLASSRLVYIIIDEWVSKLDLHTYTEKDSSHTQVEDARQSVGYPGKS